MLVQAGALAPLGHYPQLAPLGHAAHEQEHVDVPGLPQDGHLVPEGRHLGRGGVLDVEGLDGHGTVPVAAVDGPERSSSDTMSLKDETFSMTPGMYFRDN